MHKRKGRTPAAPRKPADCTCDGNHTDHVDPRISDEALRLMINVAECPAEQRALNRIAHSRANHVDE